MFAKKEVKERILFKKFIVRNEYSFFRIIQKALYLIISEEADRMKS